MDINLCIRLTKIPFMDLDIDIRINCNCDVSVQRIRSVSSAFSLTRNAQLTLLCHCLGLLTVTRALTEKDSTMTVYASTSIKNVLYQDVFTMSPTQASGRQYEAAAPFAA